ncbi:hypothetical protein [Rhizobium leguminosarum]|uniref:hypothetical protein n=1 Tax=Rhizobium leguminosarum TaxID=384 RepID=UPI0010136E2B|nr:hypothetical protein [Rhizobium leguminosarum]
MHRLFDGVVTVLRQFREIVNAKMGRGNLVLRTDRSAAGLCLEGKRTARCCPVVARPLEMRIARARGCKTMPVLKRPKVGSVPAIAFFLTSFACMGSETSQRIEPRRPSAESEFPFAIYGRPASTLVEGGGRYNPSIRKYPDASACLVETERTNAHPDLTRVNWDSMDLTTDVDVCVFRILTSIGHIGEGRRWFETQGFQLSRIIRDMPFRRDEISYEASIDKYQFNKMIGNQLNFLQLKFLVGISIGVQLDKNANVRNVILTSTWE